MATKKEVLEEHLNEWLSCKGKRKARKEITERIASALKIHPKSVSRAFKRIQMSRSGGSKRRGRPTLFGTDVTATLKELWEIGGEACAENLHPLIPEYITILKRDGLWKHHDEMTNKLLAISLGTLKIRVGRFKRLLFPSYGRGTTKAGTIHHLIPVRSGPWHEAPVGTMQVDTVAHCGGSVAGDYVFTVNTTDVATLWSARKAQWNKGQEVTVRSMTAMDEDTPFPIVEWHPDSGSEFVNWHCYGWATNKGQKMTRSRPNHKNDNCFVEERNGHQVRRWVGCARFDDQELVFALNNLYDVLTPYLNHFMTSRRVVSKERMGSKWIIKREGVSKTPYQRVLEREDVTDEVKTKLKTDHAALNPLLMKQEIDRRTKILFTILKQHRSPMSTGKLQ